MPSDRRTWTRNLEVQILNFHKTSFLSSGTIREKGGIFIRNVLTYFSLLFIIFALVGCSSLPEKVTKSNSTSVKTTTVKSRNNKGQAVELKGQDVSDITKLATPDELVYLHNGVKTTYKKDNPKFIRIIQMNTVRQTKQLDACKCMLNVASNGDYLIYNYTTTNYVPVYFKLVPSPDEGFENNLFNYYGSNPIPSDEKNDPKKLEMYGHLAPADELLAYLNAKLQN